MKIQVDDFQKKIDLLKNQGNLARNTDIQENQDFKSILNSAINEINKSQKLSDVYDDLILTGKIDNTHEPLIAAKKAEIMFAFGLEVRSQLLEAYKELMRIQL